MGSLDEQCRSMGYGVIAETKPAKHEKFDLSSDVLISTPLRQRALRFPATPAHCHLPNTDTIANP